MWFPAGAVRGRCGAMFYHRWCLAAIISFSFVCLFLSRIQYMSICHVLLSLWFHQYSPCYELDKLKIPSSPCANYQLCPVAWCLLRLNIKSRRMKFLWSRILKYLQFDCCHSPVLLIQQSFRQRWWWQEYDCNRIIAANKKAAMTELIYTPWLGEQLSVAWRHHRRGVISPALP